MGARAPLFGPYQGLSPQCAFDAFSLMVSLLIRSQVLWDQDPTFITPFNLNHLLKAYL